MMKKCFLLILVMVAPLFVAAQETTTVNPLFGFFSYEKVLTAMNGYEQVQSDLVSLKQKYDAETKRSEEDFNHKYELFLEGQRDFAPSILQKRRSELTDMLQKNVAFRQESARLLKQAEADALAPLKAKINEVLARIGQERNFLFIVNTDDGNLPYVHPLYGTDITELVIAEINQ